MEPEKIIQIEAVLDTGVSKTVYFALTNKGKMFRSYDLNRWDIVTPPTFTDTSIKLNKTSLYGEGIIK